MGFGDFFYFKNSGFVFNERVESYFYDKRVASHFSLIFHLSRNLLKGQVGDEINVLMAACAWNLRKWLIATAIFLFWQKVGLCMVRSLYFFYYTQ